MESKTYELSEGDILVIAPTALHRSENISDNSLIPCLNINMINSESSDKLFKAIYPCCKITAPDFLLSLAHSLYLDRDEYDAYTTEILELKNHLFIAEIIRMILKTTDSDKSSEADKLKDKLEVIENFFANPLNHSLCANDLADILHISPRHLNRVLIANYGMNFSSKLTYHRLFRASWLLRNTSMPIEDIYLEVGYSSKSAFFKAFKEYAEMTPSQYRKSFIKIKKKKD